MASDVFAERLEGVKSWGGAINVLPTKQLRNCLQVGN